MVEKVLSFIKEQNMIPEGSRGIAAVSGGADSMCLMHILHELAPILKMEFTVFHLNHGIRGEEAERDAEHVRRAAEELGLPCCIRKVDVPALAKEQGISLEEAGRRARYDSLAELKEKVGASWLALAHQKEDQAETILFHIIRGTGIRGLRGIRPVQGDRIRPLLDCSRAEIEHWLDSRGIEYVTDSTNLENEYTRNRIRNHIFPMLQELNPGVKEHMLSLAKQANELYDIQEQMVERLRESCEYRLSDGSMVSYEDWKKMDEPGAPVKLPDLLIEERGSVGIGGNGEIDTNGSNGGTGVVLLGELILSEIGRIAGHRRDVTREHIASGIELFSKETGKKVDLPRGVEALRSFDGVILRRKGQVSESGSGIRVLTIEKQPYYPGFPYPEGEEEKAIDAATVKGTLRLRTPMPQDVIVINAEGGRKKLSRFFTDHKVAKEDRADWPVVVDDEKVIWVVGLRLAENCKLTDDTREVYIIHIG